MAARVAAAAALALSVAACGQNPFTTASWGTRNSLSERECMARAMYFESNRSSEDGMSAVGTVVMNRLQSGRYPKTVCGVVGQHNQFAQGALSNPVSGRSWSLALAKADAVLAGERHDRVGAAMHFHTAGHTFPYRNMAYVVAAGGNVFYEKKTPGTFTPIHPNVFVAEAKRTAPRGPGERLLASVDKPSRRGQRSRLAHLEDREAPPQMRVPDAVRTPIERSGQADAPARRRNGSERVRLASLGDDLPKASRSQTDAPRAAFVGAARVAERSSGKGAAKDAVAHTSSLRPAATPSRLDAPQAARGRSSQPKPEAGQPLSYRGAKSRPASFASPEQLGWRKGPDGRAKSKT